MATQDESSGGDTVQQQRKRVGKSASIKRKSKRKLESIFTFAVAVTAIQSYFIQKRSAAYTNSMM